MSRSFWIDGIATLTIATSRIVMKNAAPTTARTNHFLCWCSVMTRPLSSVPEVPSPREHHNRSGCLCSSDHLGVPLRAAGLDDPGDPARQRQLGPVGKGEEGVGGEHRPLQVVAEVPRLLERDPHRVHATLLSRADAEGLEILRDDDRVRPDVLADPPREEQVAPLFLARRSGDDGHCFALLDVAVAILDEQSARNPLVVALAGLELPPLPVHED